MTIPAYSIIGTVNGQRLMWPIQTLDEAEKLWERFATHRVVPGTQDKVTGLVLMFGDKKGPTLLDQDA